MAAVIIAGVDGLYRNSMLCVKLSMGPDGMEVMRGIGMVDWRGRVMTSMLSSFCRYSVEFQSTAFWAQGTRTGYPAGAEVDDFPSALI